MALFKRNKTWWTDFSVHGQRYRQSLNTKDWREAQAKEKELIAQASDGKLSPKSMTFARQPFGEAADAYVTARKLELAQASQAKEKQLVVQLRAYFKQELLRAITVQWITDYREWRADQGVGPAISPTGAGAANSISRTGSPRNRVRSACAGTYWACPASREAIMDRAVAALAGCLR